MTDKHSLKPAPDDLANRRPVWEALSTLFLDTEPALLRGWRAQVLAGSDYSLAELERILRDEISPVCGPNLRSVAGEWAGFDAGWLEERILRLRRGWLARLGRGLRLSSLEWRRTREEIVSLRADGALKPPVR